MTELKISFTITQNAMEGATGALEAIAETPDEAMRIAVEANEQSEPGVVITDTRGRRYSIAEFRDAMRQGELR